MPQRPEVRAAGPMTGVRAEPGAPEARPMLEEQAVPGQQADPTLVGLGAQAGRVVLGCSRPGRAERAEQEARPLVGPGALVALVGPGAQRAAPRPTDPDRQLAVGAAWHPTLAQAREALAVREELVAREAVGLDPRAEGRRSNHRRRSDRTGRATRRRQHWRPRQ